MAQHLADALHYDRPNARWTLSVQLPRTRVGVSITHPVDAPPTPPSLADFALAGLADGTLPEGTTLAWAPATAQGEEEE
ncbi:MAG: hypothetical protein KIS74_03050 [Burkholderiales bacterium]|nr:hypothetical protein [Burkholderiales bacterium]